MPKKVVMPDAEKSMARDMREKGMSTTAIANKLGYDYKTLGKHTGLPFDRKGKGAPKYVPTPETIKKVHQLKIAGMTHQEVLRNVREIPSLHHLESILDNNPHPQIPRKKKNDSDMIRNVIAMYKGGKSYGDIAKQHRITRGVVAGILNRNKNVTESLITRLLEKYIPKKTPITLTDEQRKSVYEMRKQGMRNSQISKKFGMSHYHLSKHVDQEEHKTVDGYVPPNSVSGRPKSQIKKVYVKKDIPHTPEQYSKILKLKDEGLNHQEIALRMKMPPHHIGNIIKQNTPDYKKPEKNSSDKIQQIIDMRKNGETYDDIASKHGMTRGKIAGIIHRNKHMLKEDTDFSPKELAQAKLTQNQTQDSVMSKHVEITGKAVKHLEKMHQMAINHGLDDNPHFNQIFNKMARVIKREVKKAKAAHEINQAGLSNARLKTVPVLKPMMTGDFKERKSKFKFEKKRSLKEDKIRKIVEMRMLKKGKFVYDKATGKYNEHRYASTGVDGEKTNNRFTTAAAARKDDKVVTVPKDAKPQPFKKIPV